MRDDIFREQLSSDEAKRRAVKGYKAKEYEAPRALSESSEEPTSFKQAFAEARKSGDKNFTFKGKKYTTELKTETKPAPKPAKPAAETKGGFRDISQSPRLNDMVEMQNIAAQASNRARDKNNVVINQEQKRLADIAQRNVVPLEESAKSEDRMLKAYKESEPAYLESNIQDARSAKALADQGYRKGGKVAKTKTFARGGKVSSASGRGDGIAQRGKTKGRIC